ncbi:MAG: tail fiber domain-containing protein [Ginsengibacter sp.]
MKRIMCVLFVIFSLQFHAQSQNVGIGTTTPKARLHVTDSSVLFSAPGDIPAAAHNTPISLGGRRLMWYPDKAAFRVGYTVYDEWDSVNIGKYSIGMGYGNYATGKYSASIGHGSGASGISSFATGELTNAQGNYTFTTGQYTTGKGAWSFAAGYQSNAKNIAGIAMGYNAIAGGNYAVALGNNAFANGNYSCAFGNNAASLGDYSSALGSNTSASGNYSFAAGNTANAVGIGSAAVGYITNAGGDYSFAAGVGGKANGYASFASGSFTIASGDHSTAMGDNCTASGQYSFAEGVGAKANAQLSVAIGTNVTATGDNSMIFGANLFDGGHKGNAMFGDTDPWNAGSVGSGTNDQMICRFTNGYYFITGGNTNRTGIVANHGDNSWSAISDSTKKEKVLPVNGEEFLHKISQFKLATWNYKGQDSKTFRHYGPMAQDFHNAFGHDALGNIGCDTLINQQDFLGVSFIAIQALEKRTEKIEVQQKQLSVLLKQNEALTANNEKLQKQLQTLMSTVVFLNKKVEEMALSKKKNNSSGNLTANK